MAGTSPTDILKNVQTLLKPQIDPKAGPLLPASWNVGWPGFFQRGIRRIIDEPPWKTLPQRGLKEELKREIYVVTGRKV